MGKGARWILAGTIGLLAFVGVGASAAHYLQEPYNPGFLDFPTVVALHVVHREWMIRAFAIGLAIATARLIFFPVLLITMVDPTEERFGTLLVVALAVAFVLHASVAELWICVTRRSCALKADGVKAE